VRRGRPSQGLVAETTSGIHVSIGVFGFRQFGELPLKTKGKRRRFRKLGAGIRGYPIVGGTL
jgi:hypothetical protein